MATTSHLQCCRRLISSSIIMLLVNLKAVLLELIKPSIQVVFQSVENAVLNFNLRNCPDLTEDCSQSLEIKKPCLHTGEEQSFREHERLRASKASRRLFEFNVTVTTGPPESIFRHTKVRGGCCLITSHQNTEFYVMNILNSLHSSKFMNQSEA